jgi:hypothetical protein
LKSLYVRGHVNGRPISRILVDGGTASNMMPYFVLKMLAREDDELMKTNLILNGVAGNPMEARGVVSMEHTIGSKSLATAFLLIEVHVFIQWIHDEINVVHADTFAYIIYRAAWECQVPVGEGTFGL